MVPSVSLAVAEMVMEAGEVKDVLLVEIKTVGDWLDVFFSSPPLLPPPPPEEEEPPPPVVVVVLAVQRRPVVAVNREVAVQPGL